jgi:4-amino-4-deoxy-L-arabinose transferase-like glycosyltransferase
MTNDDEMSSEADPAPGSETTPVARSRTAALTARLRDRRLAVHAAWVVLILIVALTVRNLWVAYAPSNPTDGRMINDTLFYHYSAVELSEGKGYVNPWRHTPTAQWPPGYSLLLAGLYRVFGPHVALAWGVNIVLGALTCVVLYFVGCLALGDATGRLAGLLLAVFPGHVFFSSLVLSEVTFTFLLTVAMLLILLVARQGKDGGVRLVIILGAVVGAAALTRGQGLFLIVVALLFWWLLTADWRRALRRTAVIALAAMAVILPWSIRNYVDMGGFVFISTNVGDNLYVGNFEGATGRVVIGAVDWAYERYAYLPRERQEVAASNLLLREGLKFMFTHPGREIELAGSKIRALYEDDEEALRGIPNRQAGETIPHEGRIADVANGFYFAVLAVSAGGLAYWLRRRRSAVALPLLVIGVFTLGELPFFADPRFHFPMLPSLALLTAVGLVWGAGEVRRLVARL